MCDSIEDGGKRCAAHTRPYFDRFVADLKSVGTFERAKIRNSRDKDQVTAMMRMIDFASTPSGAKEVTTSRDKFKAAGDKQTAMMMTLGLQKGALKAEIDTATKKAIQRAREKAARVGTNSTTELKVSKKALRQPESSLEAVYPTVAAWYDPALNQNITADQIASQQNADIYFKCARAGHLARARLNNVISQHKKGRLPGCEQCRDSNQRDLGKLQEDLESFRDAVGNDPQAWQRLSPVLRHEIMQRTGMLASGKGGFRRASATALASGELTLQEALTARRADRLEERVDEDGLLSEEEQGDREIDLTQGLTTPASDDVFGGSQSTARRIDSVMNSAGIASLVEHDSSLVTSLRREAIENLWTEVQDEPENVERIVAQVNAGAAVNPYRQQVADQFTAELRRVQTAELPAGFNSHRVRPNGDEEDIQPLLSQKRFALLVEDRKRVMNWSGTGAGKTLSAVLATRQVNAQETLVICPLSVVGNWEREYEAAFPDAEVRHGLPGVDEDLDATKTPGRPRVWIANYDKFSKNPEEVERRLIGLEERIDAVVLDEIHMAKSSDKALPSQRAGVLQGFMDRSGENNPDLAVVGMSATPVVNDLSEAKSLLRLTTGREPVGFGTEPTLKNAATAYRHLSEAGVRWRPKYKPGLEREEVMIDVTANLPRVQARIAQFQAELAQRTPGKAPGPIHPAIMERALLPEKLPMILKMAQEADGPSIVYTEYTTGVVDPIVEHMRSNGLTAARFTGAESQQEREQLIKDFQEGKVRVLVGSRPIATGVDGLQRVSHNTIVASPAWTAAQDDQLVGRTYRTGQTEKVHVTYVGTEAKVGDLSWSWCRDRLNRIKFKRSLSDAAVDGVIPEGHLGSSSRAAADSIVALNKLSADIKRAVGLAA